MVLSLVMTAARARLVPLALAHSADGRPDADRVDRQSRCVYLLVVNLLLLFVGCFMEALAAMLILIPILVPVSVQLGIDPLHFGLVFVLNLMIGTITPPVGIVLFVTAKVANISFDAMARAIVPWIMPLLAVLIAITLWPPLTTWLPGIVMGR